jgi:L-ascorbate metabolism protein UlaG (beta-lactamase superfamily)
MDLGRIGHATLVVRTADVTCAMDPVLRPVFDDDLVTFDPPVAIDVDGLRDACNLIVISHEHGDHFDVASLAALDRDAVVYYPAGARRIAHALARLGFAQARAVAPGGEDITLADLRLVPTPSRVPFAEMGVVLAAGGATAWNLVDSRVDAEVIAQVRDVCGPIDVLLAPWQPLVQRELATDALGAGFPFAAYGALLATIAQVAPRWVVPSACGVRYTEAWLDDRGFPMTEARFVHDVAALGGAIGALPLPAGGALVLGDGAPRPRELPFARPTGDARGPRYDWRPTRGVPPLVDRDRHGLGAARLRREVAAILDELLLPALDGAEHAAWRARMAALGATWRLEVVYPDGGVDERWCDLGAGRLRWSAPRPGGFASIHTAITASAAAGLRDGRVHPDRLTLGDLRTSTRLYAVAPDGAVTAAGSDEDEPLCRVLLPGAADRHLDRALAALGA